VGWIDGDEVETAGEDSGTVNLWAWRKCGKQSPTQTIKGSAIGLLRVGNLIDLDVRLDTICSACKENDSTYSEVIDIVVRKNSDPGTGEGTILGTGGWV